MNDFEKSVLKIIEENPGIKAKKIAEYMGCERRSVNSAIYGTLKDYCYQDSTYRWYINIHDDSNKSTKTAVKSDKQLADICKYYLNCLSLEKSNGISSFLTSNSSLNYVELSSLTVNSADENIARLILRQI